MSRSSLSIPFNILTLVGEFYVELPGTFGYKIKVWQQQDGHFVARVSIRIRTADRLVTFESNGDSVETAADAAISSVSAVAAAFSLVELEDHVEYIPAEYF